MNLYNNKYNYNDFYFKSLNEYIDCLKQFNKLNLDLIKETITNLLQNLTECPKQPMVLFLKTFENIYKNNNHHLIGFFYKNDLAGIGTLLIEPKFIRNCGSVAHIEDIVIDPKYQGKGFGKILIQKLIEESKKYNCYKIILDCSEENVKFYQKCGFKKKSIGMSIYLNH